MITSSNHSREIVCCQNVHLFVCLFVYKCFKNSSLPCSVYTSMLHTLIYTYTVMYVHWDCLLGYSNLSSNSFQTCVLGRLSLVTDWQRNIQMYCTCHIECLAVVAAECCIYICKLPFGLHISVNNFRCVFNFLICSKKAEEQAVWIRRELR